MNIDNVKAFGPVGTNLMLKDCEPQLLKIIACQHHSTPNSDSKLEYHRATDGKLLVILEVGNDQADKVELCDVIDAKDWLPGFLGWLMPKRVGHNCDLPNEILSAARQLIEKHSAKSDPTPICRNWLPGTDDSMGKICFALNRKDGESAITMAATYMRQ